MTNGEWISLGGAVVSLLGAGVGVGTAVMVWRLRSSSLASAIQSEQIKAKLELTAAIVDWAKAITFAEVQFKSQFEKVDIETLKFRAEEFDRSLSDLSKHEQSFVDRTYAACIFLPQALLNECTDCFMALMNLNTRLFNRDIDGEKPIRDEAHEAAYRFIRACRDSHGVKGSITILYTHGIIDRKNMKHLLKSERN